jgi:hypothetical protein
VRVVDVVCMEPARLRRWVEGIWGGRLSVVGTLAGGGEEGEGERSATGELTGLEMGKRHKMR